MPQIIESLNPRHFIILDLFLGGLAQNKIAEKLGMTPQAIYIITNSPSFQHELAIRRNSVEERVNDSVIEASTDALKILRDSSSKAANKLVSLMESAKEEVSQKSAMDILDRVGVCKIVKSPNNNVSAIFCIDAESALLLRETLALDSLPKKVESVVKEKE